MATGERHGSEVDAERHPQLAARSDPGRTASFKLTVEAHGLFANQHWVAVFVAQFETPFVFDIGLIPRHPDADRDGNVLGTWSDHTETASENEELAAGDLHGIAHQDECSKIGRAERQVWLVHRVSLAGQGRVILSEDPMLVRLADDPSGIHG